METATLPQHMQALRLGDNLRLAGASWRRDIGAMPRVEALRAQLAMLRAREIPPYVGVLTVPRFLTAAPRVGESKARRMQILAGVRPRTVGLRVRDLTPHERYRLAREIERVIEVAR